jgi:lysylphosphatidylglycerol synthetase-like protein (DUF2156 family)
MSQPGLAGRRRRRIVAASVFGLGLLDTLLAAVRHPLLRIGPLHRYLPEVAVRGSRYVLLVAALTMIMSARGLLHGKRQAWLLAVAAAGASLAAHPLKRIDLVGVLATATVLVLLLSSANLFRARPDPLRMRQGLVWLVVGEALVFLYGVAGVYYLDAHFVRSTTFSESLENATRLLFVLPSATIEPANRHGEWFIESVRAAALIVLGVTTWHLLHPVIHRQRGGRAERLRVLRILEAHARNAIAYFHLLEDKSYHFSADGEAFIGFKVVGHTAVALGEPLGPRESCLQALQSFAEFCDLNGWAFCFHQVTEPGAELLREAGLNTLKIGEEAIIHVREFVLSGKTWKHLRNTVNRLEREGARVSELAQPIDETMMAELREVSDAWLASGGHRERSFTLGAFSPAYLRDTHVFVVRGAAGRIEAFANVLPSFQSNEGNFDLMRRRPDAPDGVMDYLFVHLIGYFRERGYDGMNLGFAPLSNIEGTSLVARALRVFYARGNRAFNFQGLRAFKDKWHPEWQPRFLAFRSELQLPQLALAVARAGEGGRGLPIGLSSPFSRLRRKSAAPVAAAP